MASKSSSTLHDVANMVQDTEPTLLSGTGPRPIISVTRKASFHSSHYQFKVFKSKGALITLMWWFCGLFVYNFLLKNYDLPVLYKGSGFRLSPEVLLNAGILFYPILGWLADVWYGRYRAIKWSNWLMWFVSILFGIKSVLEQSLHKSNNSTVGLVITSCMYFLFSLGLGGFLANVIQFGIDQLIDASSSEITSFIRWFSLVWYLSGFVVSVSQTCICKQYKSVAFVLLPACLSFALCIDYIFSGLLTKEHTFKNPLTLIFRVLKYAIKNKYPRQRSACAYWDNQRCSRIDLGKSKYGGPFSTDEVENVKRFWRVLGVIIIGTFFVGLVVHIDSIRNKMINYHFQEYYVQENNNSCDHPFMKICLRKLAIRQFGNYFMVAFILVFEFILYPFFKRYFNTSIMKKFLIGIVFYILGMIALISLEVAGHLRNGSTNVTCIFEDQNEANANVLPLGDEWTIIPSICHIIGSFMLFISGGEFLCAYSPSSMKGLLFGILYGSIGFFTILVFGLLQLAEFLIKKHSSGRYGCGTWYLLSLLVLCLLALISYYCIYKWYYKKRLRIENLQQ